MNTKMTRRYFTAVLSGCLLTLMLAGCTSKEKEVIISNDIKEDIKVEEEEIKTLKDKAKEYLEDNNFQEAKNLYKKVILMDKSNKDLYLEIKNEYIKKDRLDDAYEIIRIAIDNNVYGEGMQKVLDDIESKFEVVEYNVNIKKNDQYVLPQEGEVNINGEKIAVPITWENKDVDTSNLGEFIYKGMNEQYGRTFIMNIKVEFKPLTEAEVRIITIQAKKVLTDIVSCVNFDASTMIIEEGRSFAISNNYKTKDQVMNALYEYYTDDAIYNFIENQTLEKDGVFYIVFGQGGIGLSIEEDNLSIEQTESTLKAVYTKGIDDNWTITQEYNFIKYDNSWIRSDITLYP